MISIAESDEGWLLPLSVELPQATPDCSPDDRVEDPEHQSGHRDREDQHKDQHDYARGEAIGEELFDGHTRNLSPQIGAHRPQSRALQDAVVFRT